MTKPVAKNVPAKKAAVKVAAKKVAPAKDQPVLPAHVPIVQRFQKVELNAAVKTAPKADKKAKDEDKGPSKVELAREIFKKMKNKPRKDVLEAFVAEAGLTLAGAATYYSNIKNEAK